MSNMKATTAIAMGFMNGNRSLVDVVKLTVEFLGRKITPQECRNIWKAYTKQPERILE